MPIAKKEVKKEAVVKKESVAAHKHDDLLKEIAALKKELQSVKAESAALKGQCHSCCSDVASLKKDLESLKVQKASSSKDERVDVLVEVLKKATDLEIRRTLRSKKEALKGLGLMDNLFQSILSEQK